jgi:hypothetical protein
MCYNSEISLNTFIYGVISAIIVLLLNQIEYWKIMIIMSITSMQLLEYFTWKYIDNKKINYYLSIIGAIIIVMQVTLINYCYLENGIEKLILFIIMFIGIIYIFYYCFKNNLLSKCCLVEFLRNVSYTSSSNIRKIFRTTIKIVVAMQS